MAFEDPKRTKSGGSRAVRWARTARAAISGILDCLGWRLAIVLSLTLAVLLGLSGWFALGLHRRHLVGFLEENVIRMGETILSGTHASMLENDQRHLTQIVEGIGRREEVLALRIFDEDGRVRHTSRPEELNSFGDLNAPTCRGCHAEPGNVHAPETLRDGLHFYRDEDGSQTLGMVVPILNSPECSNAACHVHPPDRRVLGILDLEVSTAALDSAMDEAGQQMLALLLGTALLAPGIAGLLAWRTVHRPVHGLLDGIQRAERGEYGVQVSTVGPGELGLLARAFNEMSGRLEQADAERRSWNEELERRVREKTEELERTRNRIVIAEKMASLGKLAAIVAHEINNPLAGVLVYAKLARRKLSQGIGTGREPARATAAADSDGNEPGSVAACKNGGAIENGSVVVQGADGADRKSGADIRRTDEIVEMLATIERETARCGEIARNLLSVSRRREASISEQDLNQIVERTVRLVHHQADLQEVTVEVELDDGLPQVACNGDEIQQALTVLVMNAIEAMPNGGHLRVRSHTLDGRDWVRLEVSDTGPGVPEELRTRIFEPFFTTKSEGSGTGLGLAVMYDIVRRHRGRTDFESVPGKGATFWIELPVEPKTEPLEETS